MLRTPATQLVRADLAVYALNLRGHGQAKGERFWVDEFSDYVADLERPVSPIVTGRQLIDKIGATPAHRRSARRHALS